MFKSNNLNHDNNNRWGQLSIAVKFVLLVVIVLAGTLSATTAVVVSSQNALFDEHLHEKGKMLGHFVSLISPEAILSYDYSTLETFMHEAVSEKDIAYAFIVAPNGHNITSLDSNHQKGSNIKQLKPGKIKAFLAEQKKNKDIVDMQFAINFNGKQIGKVHFGLSKQRLHQLTKEALIKQVSINIGIILFLSICIYLVFRFYALKPIHQLVEASQRISDGNLTQHVTIKSHDELGNLGTTFNSMMDHLQQNIQEKDLTAAQLKELNKTLEDRVTQRTHELSLSEARIRAIFDNMGEGVITFDENSRISSANPAAIRIFGLEQLRLEDVRSEMLFYDKELIELLNSSKSTDSIIAKQYSGRRIDQTNFPAEVTLTEMELDEGKMRVCIVRDITKRKKSEQRLEEAQQQLLDTAHKSGMAEMAVGVLHNIGNILNSVSLSAEEITRITQQSKLKGLIKANELIEANMDDIGNFFLSDDKGKLLPQYYLKIGQALCEEQAQVTKEVTLLREKTAMMKEVISTQQEYAKVKSFTESIALEPIIESSIKIQEASLAKWGVNIHRNFQDTPLCIVHKSKLLQVLTNLIKNASEAMRENDISNKTKELSIETGIHNETFAFVTIADNGCGIQEKDLNNIFNHGFTTKSDGHGFGLHASANAMTEMHGSLKVESEGLNHGASFTLYIPISTEKNRVING